jgi:hypothetical protein
MRSGTARITAATAMFTGALYAFDVRADAVDCNGFREIEPGAGISLGVIKSGARRVHFLKNASEQKSCPGSSPECHEKDFVRPGDRIIASIAEGEFLCADHVNSRGVRRSGWLPRAAINLLPERTPPRVGWVGQWTGGPEQAITIAPTPRAGEFRFKGEASFGAFESGRPNREAIVSTGELEGRAKPSGNFVAFTTGNDGTLPYDQGDEYDCRVKMRRLGPFLLVEDNGRCGGINVSFSGMYLRRNPKP